ncbi:Unknown protein [Striga hermonthica]|uniref:Uncharacterized protein n=1 Tax=Striga hermonthica TaxID=68872 RepID=A0A9N7P3P1_STRHE|nr:Unknown protein [Striga hermonthica]
MGNCLCLVHQDDKVVVRVMKPDGKILEYEPPVKVQHVLSNFSHHAITDELPVKKHMLPSADLAGARLYYLLPLTVPPPRKPANENRSKKRVRFSDDVKGGSDGSAEVAPAGTVRIKLVISKQELQAMLSREGALVDGCCDAISKDRGSPLGSTAEVN